MNLSLSNFLCCAKRFLLGMSMLIVTGHGMLAQTSFGISRGGATYYSFIDYQRSFSRPQEALARKVDTLKKQFAAKKLSWPANYIYLRSFKYDSQLEVWVKQKPADSFRLFKVYPVCALAGALGPKRMEGDYQVPEGFYYINEFNPNSSYYLSLGINYPNASDKVLSNQQRPGGAIYIHGSCVTVGCIPITDQQIDELYVLAAYAREQGQHYIPIHIFPCRYDVPKSAAYLNELTKDDTMLKDFSEQLKDAYTYFEKNRKLPIVMITDDGRYHINEAKVVAGSKASSSLTIPTLEPKGLIASKVAPPRKQRQLGALPEYVDEWPRYPGGAEAFSLFLENTSKAVSNYLPANIKRAFIQVEFVVDKDGSPVNFSIVRGLAGGEELHQKLIEQLETMPAWTPALLAKRPVPKKMLQTLTIDSK
ncbi:MAG: L,D-transpeptidase family protein [Sphingomonadales bacterium]